MWGVKKQMKLMKDKKGTLDIFEKLISGVLLLVILGAVSFLIIANVRSQVAEQEGVDETNSSTFTQAYNSTVEIENAAYDIPGWIPLVVLVVIAVGIYGLVKWMQKGSGR